MKINISIPILGMQGSPNPILENQNHTQLKYHINFKNIVLCFFHSKSLINSLKSHAYIKDSRWIRCLGSSTFQKLCPWTQGRVLIASTPHLTTRKIALLSNLASCIKHWQPIMFRLSFINLIYKFINLSI